MSYDTCQSFSLSSLSATIPSFFPVSGNALFHPSLCLGNTALCMCAPSFLYPSVCPAHLSCFCVVAIVPSAAMILGAGGFLNFGFLWIYA